jgi:hypothetical protein
MNAVVVGRGRVRKQRQPRYLPTTLQAIFCPGYWMRMITCLFKCLSDTRAEAWDEMGCTARGVTQDNIHDAVIRDHCPRATTTM